MKFLRSSFSIVLLLVFIGTHIHTQPAFSQTITGTLIGLVIANDPQKTPLSGVIVRVTNVENRFVYATRTQADGQYRIALLPPAEYEITAEKDGYRPGKIEKFFARVNETKEIKPPPITLEPISTPLPTPPPPAVPTPGTLQVNINDATLRGSIAGESVAGLPLPGIRGFDTLALLVPGVAPPPATFGNTGPGIGSGVGTAGQFSINGQRARANNFTIDGSDNNDQEVGVRRQGFTPPTPQTIESITEVQVSTLLSDSESGRNTGGQVNVVSKTGSKEIHGNAYGFFTDSRLQARDAFDFSGPDNPAKNPQTRVQAGGAIGFPVLKDRLFGFVGYEHQTVNQSRELHFISPTLDERNAALNATTRSSLLGLDVLNPRFFPLPNNPGGPYGSNTLTRILNASGHGSVLSGRLDSQKPLFGKVSELSGRYNLTDDTTRIPSVDGGINAGITALTRTQNIALSVNSTLSRTMANQIRFSYGRTGLGFEEVAESPLLFQSNPVRDINGDGRPDGRTGPIGRVLFVPYSPIGVDPGTFPQQRATNTYQFADTFIYSSGRNTVKFGIDLRRVQLNSRLDRNYRAQLAFTPAFARRLGGTNRYITGVETAGLGLPSDFSQALAVLPDSRLALRFTELNLFVHDRWRIAPRVTVDFGLRYERNTVPTDATGRLETTLTLQEGGLPPFDPNNVFTGAFLRAFRAQQGFLAGRTRIYDGDNNNFAPRIGMAIDLSGNGRRSIRGGYGMFYDPILGTIVSQSRNAFPNFIPINLGFGTTIPLFSDTLAVNPTFIRFRDLNAPLIRPGTVNTIGLSPNQFVNGIGQLLTVGTFGTAGIGFGAGITLPEKNLLTPYVHQYSVAYEHAMYDRYLLSVAYVGTLGQNLLRVRTPNGGQFTPFSIVTQPGGGIGLLLRQLLTRPNQSLGPVTVFESSATSSYQALQVSLSRRQVNGLGFQAGYTYAHAIDDVSDVFDLAGGFTVAQDELGRGAGLRGERGSANFDVRHRFTGAFQYDLPLWKGRPKLGGFQVSGILTLQTGQPFTVNSSLDVNRDGNLTDRLDSLNGLVVTEDRRTRIRIAPGTDTLSLLVPLDSFRNGRVGRNTFRASGIASLDLAVTKKIPITERQSVILRVEAFNVFNRTHFGIPVRILESPGFGQSATTSLSPRLFQFAVRYSF